MPVDRETFVSRFGGAADAGNATVLVGAGLSRRAGLPDWNDLMKGPRREAKVPASVRDLPLVAEYYSQDVALGRDRLQARVGALITAKSGSQAPSKGHELLARMPMTHLWTQNYDDLLERAMQATGSSPVVIATDSDLVACRATPGKRLIKMHGGIQGVGRTAEFVDPVLTRRDYEQYEQRRPLIWNLLKSTYLTQKMLFLGFSFDDPNINVMLRLARSLQAAEQHFTVMRRPSGGLDLRAHELRVQDLESSGVEVVEIPEYAELDGLLGELSLRLRPPSLFVSGSVQEDGRIPLDALARSIGSRLAELDISLASLAGTYAGKISHAFARTLRQRGVSDAPEKIRFFFPDGARKKESHALMGTRIHTQDSVEDLRASALQDVRAFLLFGGGSRTRLEVDAAREQGLPVIPVAITAGTALIEWRAGLSASRIPVPRDSVAEAERHWQALAQPDTDAVALAVQRLVRWATYSS
ncbi:SIR2 family protein [Motilibacter rhizosphaerae]|nr:SIR2 family protein [Motilibacter rhizosphaerae]